MDRLAYDEAGDLYGRADHRRVEAADPDVAAALHLAGDVLLTAGDVAGGAAIDVLDAAAGSNDLSWWYTTYEGLLAVLGEPERLTEIVQSIGAAAGAMRDVGYRREAKARYVHVPRRRPGQIGAGQPAVVDTAGRGPDRRPPPCRRDPRGDRTRRTLGSEPGSRPASGRCLDVVRVLRITSGTAAVEAVTPRRQARPKRCGATMLRGRTIASSRPTVEALGVDVAVARNRVGSRAIELLDGESVAAEAFLRVAHDGLREPWSTARLWTPGGVSYVRC